MNERYNEYKHNIEKYLSEYFDLSDKAHKVLLDSMRYSLLSGGKRIRPVLTLEFCRISGGMPSDALPVACGVEMLHSYSLIHDDLPCMDNDDLRRSMPTNHKVYGETTAVLAGDALQAEAFRSILSCKLSASTRAECARILANVAGENGICGGQYMDMIGEKRLLSETELHLMCEKKTASMISAACMMGAVVGGANAGQVSAAESFGKNIGLAFQIRDDILDVCGADSELGKPIGSDAREGKNTFMSIYGLQKCEQIIGELTKRAKNAIAEAFSDTEFVFKLADQLMKRSN